MVRSFLLNISLAAALFLPVSVVQAGDEPFVVVIDAGHGGKDSGAKGLLVDEKVINLSVALRLGKKISAEHKDVKVVYTRKSDSFVELDERAEIANRNKADLFISIHTNALKGVSSVRGTETYTLGLARSDENLAVAMRENSAILLEENYKQTYEGFDPNSSESYIIFEFMQNKHMEQSVSFASEIQKRFVSVGRTDRGVRQSGFLVLRKTSMPSVLVELGYITNRNEERFMRSAEGQNKLAVALSEAFTKYKAKYDRKQGEGVKKKAAITPAGVAANPAPPNKKQPAVTTVKAKASGKIVYKVQILTSNKKLPPGAKEFKGYKDIGCYVENGVYKYTYGETSDLGAAGKMRRQVAKDFKDAFVVAFKDGKRMKHQK